MIKLTPQPVGSVPGVVRLDWLSRIVQGDRSAREALRLKLLRVLIATNLILGLNYLVWRWSFSVNWAIWPLGLFLIVAETYSYIDGLLFGITMWRLKRRPLIVLPPDNVTADVFITSYNEPVDLVRETVRNAVAITYPHQTYVLDDGNSPAIKAMAVEEGAGYIVRSTDWQGRPRHAKAGNVSNALVQTSGEFVLILDADQIPYPLVLDHTLGYFRDPKVALVQTPQWFYNLPAGDPFGSDAPLFYGPIQQGKDGWNAAFFCGSNAVLRREALMQLGVRRYVQELTQRVTTTLDRADHLLAAGEREAAGNALSAAAIAALHGYVEAARVSVRRGQSIQEVTWDFQRGVTEVARELVENDLVMIQSDLAEIQIQTGPIDAPSEEAFDDYTERLDQLASRDVSPLVAIQAVRRLVQSLDVDRADEAQPVIPLATISVTEDMATAMRLHALGWSSVYHHEILARGLAPEDLRTSLQQRLRWAQGTIQVMLRENPLIVAGLSIGQRAMYFATMWSYLSGIFSVAFLVAPMLYLFFGLSPVQAYSSEFFWRLIPFLVANQLVFMIVGWKLPTWRGQQYNLALFPLWIQAVTSSIQNVYFGKKLGFVVTPKTRQSGVYLGLVRIQLLAIGLLVAAIVVGLLKLAVGIASDGIPVMINVFWACYDIVSLSVVIDAATYQPPAESPR